MLSKIYFSRLNCSMIVWSSKKCFGTSNIGSRGRIIDIFTYFNTEITKNCQKYMKIMIF